MAVEIPLLVFLVLVAVLVVFVILSFLQIAVLNIVSAGLAMLLSFLLSKIVIGGSVVQRFGVSDGAGGVVTTASPVEMPELSWLFLAIAIIEMAVLCIHIYNEIQYRLEMKSSDEFLEYE